jgi:hypothetical protein
VQHVFQHSLLLECSELANAENEGLMKSFDLPGVAVRRL